MNIEKFTVEEIAAVINYRFEDADNVQNYEEIEVYHAAQDAGYTECSHCEHYVSYDDYSGVHSMCDDCCVTTGASLDEEIAC